MNDLVTVGDQGFLELAARPVPRADAPHSTPFERTLAGLYRQRWPALLIFVAALLVGLFITLRMEKRYTAVASVQLEQQTPRVLPDQSLDPEPVHQESERFLQTQIDRLQSRNLAETVATRTRIASSPAALRALGVEDGDPASRRARAIDALQRNVGAELGLNTRLAKITFTSLEPVVSADLANAYAEGLAATNLQSKLDASTRAKQYLTGQLAQAKGRLEGSEKRMLAYARRADLTTTVVATRDEDRGGSLRAQQLGTMTDALSGAMARRAEAEQRWAQVSNTSPLAIADVQSNPAIQNLLAQKAGFEAALSEERQRHTDEYPSVRETAAKIQELDGQIATLASNIKSTVRGRYIAAAQEERQLAGTVGQLRGAAMSERERSVGYNSLQREVETNRAFYEGLLQRYKEVAAGSGALAANVTVVDRASPPGAPSSPNMVRNMGLAGISGLILAFLFGSVRERMHQVIRSPNDLDAAVGLPSLGVVPALGNSRTLLLIDSRSQTQPYAQAEAHYSIAAALADAAAGKLPKTLLVTSCSAGEGKTTFAVGLATSLAEMGKRVLLVDGDLRRPSLHSLFGAESGTGLSDVLSGKTTARDAVRLHGSSGFQVLTAGESLESPVALLSKVRARGVLEDLAEDQDIVIVDGPPVLGLADAVLLGRDVEGVLVVVEANRIHATELDLAIGRLSGANVVGVVLTKFDAKSAGVRYGGADYYAY